MLALVASIHASAEANVAAGKGVDPRDKREGDELCFPSRRRAEFLDEGRRRCDRLEAAGIVGKIVDEAVRLLLEQDELDRAAGLAVQIDEILHRIDRRS